MTNSLIFLDTETTGFDSKVDAIIEIACVRVNDLNVFEISSNDVFHTYLNTNVKIREDSLRVHGISNQFLKNKPVFSEVCGSLLEFIGSNTLVAHNASFDINFMNAELKRAGYKSLKNKVIDSLVVARRLYPGSQVGLDALMRRFGMSSRGLHSALEDATILAKIYASMCSPKQDQLFTERPIYSNNCEEVEICQKLI